MNAKDIRAALSTENVDQSMAYLEQIYANRRLKEEEKGELDVAHMIIHLHALAEKEGGFFQIGRHLIDVGRRLTEAPTPADCQHAAHEIDRIFTERSFSDSERQSVEIVLSAFHQFQLLNRQGHFFDLAKDLCRSEGL